MPRKIHNGLLRMLHEKQNDPEGFRDRVNQRQMYRCDRQMVTPEGRKNTFIVEASTLRMAPNWWPRRIATSIGNGNDFLIGKSRRNNEGEIEAVLYKQNFGDMHLIVLND